MTTELTKAAQQALEALEEIALAGMSGTGQESEEGMRDWHARQAWKFIGIAARALDPLKSALTKRPAAQEVGDIKPGEREKAEADVALYGTGYVVDGRRVAPHRVRLAVAPSQTASQQAAPEPVALGPLAQRNIFDAIRSAYDLGYNDARNAFAVPGDSAPGYKGRDVEADHGGALFNTLARRLRNAATPEPVHPDDLAVDRFAAAMKAKLAASRAKGRGGWDDPEQCTVEQLARLLVDHIPKGDPVDVANFAMMLHQRGADSSVLATATPEPVGEPFGWGVVNNEGFAQEFRPHSRPFFGGVLESKPFGPEYLSMMDRDFPGDAPHRVVTLYTRPAAAPAPAVPEGWREAIEKMVKGIDHLAELARQWEPDYSSGADRKGWVLAKNARDEAVDLLAAAQAKGGA